MKRAWMAAAVLVFVPGCESVPDLTFAEAGGGDAGDASPIGDAGSIDQEAGCPNTSPPTLPCYGLYCNVVNCAFCMTCAPPDTCCSTKNATQAVCARMCH